MAAAYLLPAFLIGAISMAWPGSILAAGPSQIDASLQTGDSAATADQDLTALGATDWAVWGYGAAVEQGPGTSTSLEPNVRKDGGSAISDLEEIQGDLGSATLRGLGQFTGPGVVPWRFDWSNGDTVTSADSAVAGLQWNGGEVGLGQNLIGYGFRFTVPAGASPQRLDVYTHAHGSEGQLSAYLSDDPDNPLTSSFFNGSDPYNVPGHYTIDFTAASEGQTLTVEYTMTQRMDPEANPNGITANPAIYAVTLAPQLVVNGGFEQQPLDAEQDFTKEAGDTTVTGWTIGGHSINHVLGSYWTTYDGNQSIDLAGDGNGSVSQTLTTVAGQAYLLSFAYGANPQWTGASMQVSWEDDAPIVRSQARSIAPEVYPLPVDWVPDSVVVTATGTTTTLTFTNTAGSPFGMALDDVSVIPFGGGDAPIEVDAPVLINAVPNGPATGIVGRLPEVPGTYDLEFLTATTCVDGQLGGDPVTFGQTTIVIPVPGEGDPVASYFGGTITNLPSTVVETYVAARIVGPAPQTSDPSACVIAGPNNNNWTEALPLDVSDGNASADGFLDSEGNARWFRFSIVPGARATVDLSGLPADYDLLVFKDIAQAYDTLTGPEDLTRISAEFAPSAYAPSAYAPSAYAPSAYAPSAYAPSAYAPSAYAPSAYAPSAYAPSAYAPSAYAPSAYAPSAYAPSAYAPSAYAPSAYAPSAYAPDTFSPSAYASAQVRSLIAVSALDGPSPESIVVDTWNNTGDFYIRVSGKNGAFDPEDAFTLDVTLEGEACVGVTPMSGIPTVLPGSFRTIILTDSSRMPTTVAGNSATEQAAMMASLTAFAGRPEIGGVVVDIGARDDVPATEPGDLAHIRALNAQADADYACPYAKNLVAGAIKDVIDAYRDANPDLRYVVLVGGDDTIPFFRYPDQSLLGPEQDYVPPVGGQTASEASLRSNYVLGQDEYGASTTISLRASTFPVPSLAVGRLVETATEVSTMLAAYTATGDGVIDSTSSSLVTGYDFIADAADAIGGHLSAGTGTPVDDDLVTAFGISPLDARSWTAAALRTKLLGSRHDLIFLGGHFSANEALAADFATKILSTELTASPVILTNSIVFSIGCHAGYNIVDPDGIPTVTETLDWSQAFARKGASLIAGTGYQYGDTDFIEYSERIYTEFARQLRIGTGAVSIGEALVRAKQAYLRSTPDIRGLHEKALLESTLFGLPMLGVNLPAGRLPVDSDASEVGATTGYGAGAGSALDLQFADLNVSSNPDDDTRTLTNLSGGGTTLATFYRGPDGVTTNPLEPTLPLDVRNVTVDGYVLRGVGFRGGTYTEQQVTPLTGAPNTEIRGVHVPFASSVLFPIRLTTPNYFDALGASDGATRLLITPVQHVTEDIGDQVSTARVFSQIGLRLFYSNDTTVVGGHTPALSSPPEISGVQAEVNGSTVTFRARVVGDPAAGIQEVWVTYTGHADAWESLDLTQDPTDSTLWEGEVTLPSTANLRYMVQAVNGVGLVTISDLLGSFHTAAVAGAPAPAPASSTISLAGSPTSGAFGSVPTVTATLSSAESVENKTIVFTLGGAVRIATTNAAGIASTPIDVTTSSDTQLSATFYGDAEVAAAAGTQAFSVSKAATQLALTGPTALGSNQSGEFVATLTSGAVSLTQRTIAFTFTAPDGTKTVKTATTDIGGVARIAATGSPAGTHQVVANFGSAVPLPAGGTLDLTDPAYGPSASTPPLQYKVWQYAFSSTRNGNVEIYTMNPDGTNQTRRTTHNAIDTEASFSPDGKQIAFTSSRTGLGDIYKMNIDGTGLVRLTTSTAIDGAPAWSPDGTKIAFTSRRDGNFEIYVMNANGSAQTRLTNNNAIDTEPEWSPTGAKLSFTSARTGAGDIYVMNANGSGVTRLTTHAAIDGASAWSPDGTKIAFTSRRDGNFEIYVMNANGSAQTRRTNNGAIDTEPVWSVDGSKLVFASSRTGVGDIYTMNPDGTGVVRLTTSNGIDGSPASG